MKLRHLTAELVLLTLSVSAFAQMLTPSDSQKPVTRYQKVCPGGIHYMSLEHDGLPATADKAALAAKAKARKSLNSPLGSAACQQQELSALNSDYPYPVQMYDYMDYCWTPDTVSKSYSEDDELLWNLPKFDFYNFHKPQYGVGCGAFIENGRLHTFVSDFLYGFLGQYKFDMVTYNADNMQVISHKSFDASDLSNLCVAQCQYPLDETKGIGIFYNKDVDGEDWVLMDFENMTLKRLRTCPYNFGILVTDGTWLYGWRDDNCIYKIDPQTFEATKIGAHGFTQYIPNESGGMQAYVQSATYDKNTKTCYWGAFSAKTAETGFFKVDLQTAKIEKVIDTYVTQHLGMCTNPEAVSDDAPGPVTDFRLSFEGASHSGTGTFTMPTLNYKGDKTLEGTMSYRITQGSTTLATADGLKPGVSVTVPLSLKKDGNYIFSLQTALNSSTGSETAATDWSKSAKIRRYVGYDTPVAPASAILTINQEGTASLHWTAPAEGTHEGYLGSLTYDIYRIHGTQMDLVSLSQTDTTFTEQLPLGAITSYKYAVVADDQGHQSEFCYSNAAACGKPYECPMVIDFTDQDVFSLFTVTDANNDGMTWSWDDDKDYIGYARCKDFNSEYPSNDWLFSPAISLKAGRNYTLSYVATSYLLGFPEYMSISLGQGKTPKSMTQTIVPKTLAPGAKRNREASFTVAEDGLYNLGFKSCSDINMFYLLLYGFRLDVEPLADAPAAVDDFSCVAGEKGATNAIIKFTAPVKTVGGKTLTNISKITVERDINVVRTWENVKPGETLEFLDNVGADGYHDWVVYTYDVDANGNLICGDYKEQKLYLGNDVPAMPHGGIIKDMKDSIDICWEPVTTGAHGGYVDPDDIQYEVRNYYHQVQGYTKDTHMVLKCNDKDEVMNFVNTDSSDLMAVYYRLTSINSKGSVPNSDTEKALFGPIYQLPFCDSAPNGESQAAWWDVESDNQTNYIMGLGTVKSDSNGDNGCFGWYCLTATDNFSMRTTKLDFTKVKNPKLKFDLCAYIHDFTVSVSALTPDHRYIKITDVDMSNCSIGDWITIKADIPMEVADSRYDIIDFHFTGMKDKSYLYMDDVKIYDDDTSGIEEIQTTEPRIQNSSTYNLAGQRVNSDAKGIVIRNGKKYLFK